MCSSDLVQIAYDRALRAKDEVNRTLRPGDSVCLTKYDREDTATPRNNGGGYR